MSPEEIRVLKTLKKQADNMSATIEMLLSARGVKATEPRAVTVQFTSWDMEQAKYLWQLCKTNMAYLKEPKDFDKWADEIRRLREVDKMPKELITRVIEWCQNDPFWRTNIRSAGKLREKFETLLAAIQRQSQGASLL